MRPTIVYAQSDAHLSAIHTQALQEAGYEVVPVHDGEQAFAAALEEGVDLLLTDAVLPRRDGYQVTESLRAEGCALPTVILCAGRIMGESRRRAAAMGQVALLAKPIPLDGLIEEVGRLAKPATRRSPAETKAPPPSTGSLREFHFGQLLHALHGARATGVLFVVNGKKKKAVQLRDGYAVAVKSNLVTECLGNMLARRGHLSPEDVEESIARVKRGEGLQGQILVAMEVVDEDTVAKALREQAEAKLLEVFEWRRGEYRFEIGKKLQRANTLSLSGSPASLIWEGARRHVPLRRVDDYLARRRGVYPVPSETPFHRFQDVALHEEEEKIVAGLETGRALSDYVDLPERVRRVVYAATVTGLLEISRDVSEVEPIVSPNPRRAEESPDDPQLRKELTLLAQQLRDKTHYEVLGLATTADDAAVREAYVTQVERVHPDRYRNSSGAVRQVADEIYRLFSQAYESLRDTDARAQYATELKENMAAQRDQVRSRKMLSAETAFQRGEAALKARDYEGALVFFGSALEQLPSEGLYHAHYGWCLHLCHPDNDVMLREAIEHVQQGVKLARDHELPYLYLGRLFKVLGRMSLAEKMFTRAVQLRSDCVEALRELRLLNMRRDRKRGLIGRILKK